jgi:autotransporter-associated beta strand protein
VSAGPLTITNSSALGAGTKTVTISPTTNPTSNPSLRLDGSSGNITLPATMSFTTSFDALNGGVPMPNSAAIINIAGNNTIQGNFSLVAGGGGTAFLSNAGLLAITGNLTPGTTGRSLYLRGNGNGSISGNMVTGSGAWFVNKDVGTGKWTLSGTNTYNGTTTVGAGTLQFAKQVSLYNNTPASWTSSNIIVNNGATFALNVGGTGEFTVSDVDVLKALGSATGGFTNGSKIGLDTTNAAGGAFTYASIIADTNGGANSLGLIKLGSNSLVLAGQATYTGGTDVDEGSLVIAASGSIAASSRIEIANGAILDVSAFIVSGGFNIGALQVVTDHGVISGDLNLAGVLNGSGTINGEMKALAGSTISPGNSAGTLNVSSDFSLDLGAQLALELGTVTISDKVSVTAGLVTLGGSLNISFLPSYGFGVGDTFTAILNGGSDGVSGFFSNVTPINATTGTLLLGDGHEFLVNYAANVDGGITPNDVTLTALTIPEPSASIALIGGMGMLIGLRRRRRTA